MEVDINEPVLLNFVYDGLVSSPYLKPESVQPAFSAIKAIVAAFQEVVG